MKTERKFTFTLELENQELDLFKHIWIEAVDLSRFFGDDFMTPQQKEMLEKLTEFHEKLNKELI